MKLKINFILKPGIEGETPVLAILNFGYKEFDVTKQTFIYKPLRFYTGIKVTKNTGILLTSSQRTKPNDGLSYN